HGNKGMARNPQSAPPTHAEPGTRNSEPMEKSRLHQRYARDVVPTLVKDFNYTNPMQVPRLAKVIVNVGVGEAIANAKALDATVRDVSLITGQKPIVKKARKVDRPVQAARRSERRGHRHLARRAHVGIPRPADERGAAQNARFPRRAEPFFRRSRQFHAGFARAADLSRDQL